MDAVRERSPGARRYWLRLLRLFIFALLSVGVFLPMGLGGLMMYGITHPGCYDQGVPADYGVNAEDVRFPTTNGVVLRAYWLTPPDSDGATVIVSPALGSGRGTLLEDGVLFYQAGLNALLVEARTCAGFAVHSLGIHEAEDVAAAYAYLQTRPDADAARVSAHGFSSAGATSLFAAARLPELRAVSAMGNYHDFAEQLGLDSDGSPLETLIRTGAAGMYLALTGSDVRALNPLSAIESIAPRPILFIYGSREVSLPGARAMLARAEALGSPAELWIIEGASHGDYRVYAGEAYAQRLPAFHAAALADVQTDNASGTIVGEG